MSTWSEKDSIDLSARLVAHDGYRMPLVGAERRAAAEQMIGLGMNTRAMADRLCIGMEEMRRWLHEQGLRAPQPRQAWWVVVAQPSQAAASKARRKAKSKARVSA